MGMGMGAGAGPVGSSTQQSTCKSDGYITFEEIQIVRMRMRTREQLSNSYQRFSFPASYPTPLA
jgi:hypothetical protein